MKFDKVNDRKYRPLGFFRIDFCKKMINDNKQLRLPKEINSGKRYREAKAILFGSGKYESRFDVICSLNVIRNTIYRFIVIVIVDLTLLRYSFFYRL